MDGVAECPPLERGLTLGQWELGRKLGQGAFGEVFEATHAKLPGTFALKTCRISRGKGEKKVKSTTQSQGAVALAVERRAYVIQLKGVPNLPELPPSNYGDDKGYRYLAMQKMAEDLKTRVASVGGRLSPAAVAYVGNAVLETFQAAHLKGYMYFDLKPANVMLTAAGEVRVLDWGCCSSYKDFRGDMLENGRDAGNDTFRSLHSHAQSPPSPRDDLESLAHLLVWMARGSLPWEVCKSAADLFQVKQTLPVSDICSGCPGFVEEFLTICRELPFVQASELDYASLFALLQPHLPRNFKALVWAAPESPSVLSTAGNRRAAVGKSITKRTPAPRSRVVDDSDSDIENTMEEATSIQKSPRLLPGSKLATAQARRQASTRPTRTAKPTKQPVVSKQAVIVVSDSEDGNVDDAPVQQNTAAKRTLARRNVNAVFSPLRKLTSTELVAIQGSVEHDTIPAEVEGYEIPAESLVIMGDEAVMEASSHTDGVAEEEDDEFFTPKTMRKSLRLAPAPSVDEDDVAHEPMDPVQEETEHCTPVKTPLVASPYVRKSFRVLYTQNQPTEVLNPVFSPKLRRRSIWPKLLVKLISILLIAAVSGSIYAYSTPQFIGRLPIEMQPYLNLAVKFAQAYNKQAVFGVAGATLAVLLTALFV